MGGVGPVGTHLPPFCSGVGEEGISLVFRHGSESGPGPGGLDVHKGTQGVGVGPDRGRDPDGEGRTRFSRRAETTRGPESKR